MLLRFLLACVLLLVPSLGHAHDFWLEPDTFTPSLAKAFDLHLHVGDGFVSESSRAFQKALTLRFQHISARGTTNLTGRDEQKPQTRLTLTTPGLHIIRMDRDSRLLRLDAKKFTSYLEEEGLEAVLAERQRLGESDKAGRERYWRYLKVVLRAGDMGDDTATKVLGQKLELVPMRDPTSLHPGDKLRVRILFDGKLLADAQVVRHHRSKDKITSRSVRTSAKGEVEFPLDEAGVYLVRLVHMRRAERDSEADWESFWGALTFAIPTKRAGS